MRQNVHLKQKNNTLRGHNQTLQTEEIVMRPK